MRINNYQIPEGYKQTEIGVIPEDWEVGALKRFWSITDCKHITAKFVNSGIPIASIKEVQSQFVELNNAKQTTLSYYNQLIEGGRKPQSGDLIFSRNATVGEVAQVAVWHPPFAMGQDVSLLRKKSPELSTAFLQAVIQSWIVVDQLENMMVGSTFRRVNVEQIKNLTVPMPRPVEQDAIAQALADVDALIAALNKLIVKKHNLKTATMQQLLTGKKRLPGFCGEWQAKQLGYVCEIVSGGTPSTSNIRFWNGNIPWCTPTDITATSGKYLAYTARTISGEGLKFSTANLLPTGSILLCTRATVGEMKLAKFSVTTNQGFKSLIPQKGADSEFIYYLLLTQKSRLIEKGAGSTFLEVSKKDVASLTFDLPPLSEQRALATVLSDMDTEITALETRLAKTQAIKQGMMQELLTGRTRLA